VPLDHPQGASEHCCLLEAGSALGEVEVHRTREDFPRQRADLELLPNQIVEQLTRVEVLEPQV
jgi:hypothetical protein